MFGDFGTVLSQTQNQFIERFARFSRHFNSGKALVGSLFADVDLSDLEIGAMGQNLIQDFWQNERVNNMPA